MADTKQFFSEFLPARLAKDPGLAQSVNAVFQFEIANAGTWTLDLTPGWEPMSSSIAVFR